MSPVRSFRIATTGRVGPPRWWWVRLYDDVTDLRRAAGAYHPGVDFSGCYGCCQAFGWIEDGVRRSGQRGYTGVLRYSAPHLTGEIAAHELGHAALATYRAVAAAEPRFGRGVGAAEERFCYLLGELYASFEQGYHRLPGAAGG